MASITTTQAAGLSIGSIPGRYYLDKRPTDQLYDILPFIPIEGHELVLNVVDATGGTLPGLADLADAEAAAPKPPPHPATPLPPCLSGLVILTRGLRGGWCISRCRKTTCVRKPHRHPVRSCDKLT